MAAIGLWLWGKIQPFILWIGLAAAVLLLLVLMLKRSENAGRAKEQVEALQRTIQAVNRRKEIERETAEIKRATGRAYNEQLRSKWQRD